MFELRSSGGATASWGVPFEVSVGEVVFGSPAPGVEMGQGEVAGSIRITVSVLAGLVAETMLDVAPSAETPGGVDEIGTARATRARGMTASPNGCWYAVRTRARHEFAVKRELDQLDDDTVQAFLPTITKWSRWRDRKKQVDWPLFPGYCFAKFDIAERLAVLKRTGVVDIVSVAGEPAPIPEQEIEGVRQLVESDLQFDPCPLIREGEMVEVKSGPLAGSVGRLVRKGAHARLVLSVDLIGQGASVEVDAADVRPY